MKNLFFLLFLASSLSAWDQPFEEENDEECYEQNEDCKRRGFFQLDDTNNTYLRDEASWPSKNQDPTIDALTK